MQDRRIALPRSVMPMDHGVITPSAPSQAQTLALLGPSLDRLPLAMILSGPDGRIALANDKACVMFGWPSGSLVGEPLDSLIPERFRLAHPGYRAGFFAEPRARMMGAGRDLFARRRDGTEFPVEIGLNPVPVEGGLMVLSAIVDITERKEREAAVQRSLEEKELLLAEIHHRVKNNLQVIASLLRLQAASFTDERLQAAFDQSQSRVTSMALIHEKLYKGDELATVEVALYIEELFDELVRVNDVQERITRSTDIDPGLTLGLSTMVPLGLLLNELITNSLKHAFRGRAEGRVTLALHRVEDAPPYGTAFDLLYADDGTGIPLEKLQSSGDTLGATLIEGLVEQLNGHMTVEGGSTGTRYMIRFKGR